MLASRHPRLFGEGRAIALGGLDLDDARTLVEGWLGRTLDAAECQQLERVRAEAGGNPLQLKQAMAAPGAGARPDEDDRVSGSWRRWRPPPSRPAARPPSWPDPP